MIKDKDGFLQKVKPGQTGLLLLGINESSPFDGYTDAKATEKKRMRNVFKTGDCWFNSGDLVKDLGFGHGQFVDRLGDTFRWKGEYLAVLLDLHL
ncbi:MAG: hypothetical protein GY866_41885 [Proteobacteria bacterium]|nr:hypothetical protein [Pseudomonadota bacterium]